MKNIKLILEFDGTDYCGWQRQKNAMTVQERLENAIKVLTGEEIAVIGCSRTDSGVHAKGFVANFNTASNIPPERYREAINAKLPEDIVVLHSCEVPMSFHSRYSAKGKTYCYTILNSSVRSPLMRKYSYLVKGRLDINSMERAAESFIGTHDFTAFKSTGSSVKTSVRTISDLSITCQEKFIKIYATADGFLYNMVRIIVGTLIDVGRGKTKPESIKDIIELKNRMDAGICVPPEGLTLEKVYY